MNYDRCIRAGGPPLPGRQRGATLIIVAGFLVALLTCMALAIEVGRLYAAQSSLENAADMAALNAARAIGGCVSGTPPSSSAEFDDAVVDAIDNALAQNDLDDVAITHEHEPGSFQETSPRLTFVPGTADPDSVRITLTRPLPKGLTGLFSDNKRKMHATSTAVSRPVAQISVGSNLVSLNKTGALNRLLSALLGSSVTLNVASYESLLNADITLADLVQVSASAGTPEELLDTNLTLPGALQLLADAVDASVAGAGGLAGATLDTLADAADPSRTVLPGDVIVVEEGLENLVDQVPINVADLLTALAQAANEGAPISLPVSIQLPPLATADATINIIEPPKIAIGRAGIDPQGDYRTVAESSTAKIQLRLTVLGFPDSALLDLPLTIWVSNAQARLASLECANPLRGRQEHEVTINTRTSIAQIGIGEFDDINSPYPDPTGEDTTLVDLSILSVKVESMSPIDIGSGTHGTDLDPISGPFPPEEGAEPQTVPTSTDLTAALNNALATLANDINSNTVYVDSSLSLLSPIIEGLLNGVVDTVGGLVNLVVSLVQPVLNMIGSALLAPLFELLGLDIAEADVTVHAVLVDRPYIYGHDQGEQE